MDITKYADNPAETLELKHPIEWGSDNRISRLYFRRAKFKDIRETESKNATATAVNLLCRLTGATPPIIDEMDGEDFMGAMAIVEGFIPKPKKRDGDSGSEPSPEE